MIDAFAALSQSLMRAFAIATALGLLAIAAPGRAVAAPITQIATYPVNNASRVAPEAELYFVFDQPTAKSGAFSVADLDSGGGGVLLALQTPRWSALGDTVFLKPIQPMTFGHLHGMKVNVIEAPDPQNSSVDLPLIYFNVAPRANVVRVGKVGLYESVSLVPGVPTPITIGVEERAGTAATFTRARYRFYPSDEIDLNAPFSIVPTTFVDVPFYAQVPRRGTAALTVPVTLTRDLAARSGGTLGFDLVFEGFDETGLAYSFSASSRVRTNTFPGDNTLVLTRAQVTPTIGASIAIGSVFLERPLPGTILAAGDTLLPRAVVTGIGTGPYRGAFYMDGEFVALAEGFLESGRPDTVSLPGPLPTRRIGEHRLQFVVEAPQSVGSAPITFLVVNPEEKKRAEEEGAEPPKPKRVRFGTDASLTQASNRYRGVDGSVVDWTRARFSADLGGGAQLEAQSLWRLRIDDTKNGSGSPEQTSVRLTTKRAIVEWGDLAPNLAAGSPLFASPVPRRAAQATWNGGGLGTVETYVALESHPRSAGGPAREARSDLYAARLSRSLGARLRVSAYGGYTHDDPTPGGVQTATLARAVYGGSGALTLPGGWRWAGDLATVRHRAIAGVETGRSRTGLRTELAGRVAGADLRAEGFRYQPDLATELNPYAISDRRGAAVSVSRTFHDMLKIYGDYRFEEPDTRIGPVVLPGGGTYGGVPYVSVERIALGTRLSLGPSAAVSPVLIRIHHRGAQTDLTEKRFASEFTAAEPLGGRTSARVDVALFDDKLGVGAKRKLIAGSAVTTRRHPGRMTSTLAIGVENDKHADLDLTDRSLNATFELRWEAIADRFLVTPYVVYNDRKLESRGVEEELVSGRLQFAAQRLPALRGGALAVEGRIARVSRRLPTDVKDTDYGVSVTLSHNVPVLH
ncbi:MAG TPA: hypothetical protein VFU59_01035 [Candidatus Eisenbacteria bacterium]|nr:hypothetical protein [Candidatus Eisenbacteria bacterium]